MLDKQKLTDEELRRLSWRCRRGLLELDIVLQRFLEMHLNGLSKQELVAFDALLNLPDNEFLDLVTSRIIFSDIDALKIKKLNENAIQTVITKLSSY